ncbi:MAG TPA: glycoside hydrolase family 5 protein [Allosphingosinicella sp.]|jgi:endoglucanase
MILKRLFAAALALAAAACTAPTQVPGPSRAASAEQPQFRRGVNILGYDAIWDDPAKARFQAKHFQIIRKGGFDFVRVNLHAFRHMDEAHRLSAAWLDRLDWVVREATRAGLGVILDEHDFEFCGKDATACRPRLLAFWRQVAPRYRHAPSSVAFELLNEPHGELDAARWNALSAQALGIVRETNPTRTVVIGPTRWNNMNELPTLKLPAEDRNILVTFHSYEPFRFTHQGAPWANLAGVSGVTFGDADLPEIRAGFAKAADWARANRRPILLGEFGAYDKGGTPMAMRAAYTDAIAREAERNGFAWAYWQFDSDFIAYDIDKGAWVEPIRRALVPSGRD